MYFRSGNYQKCLCNTEDPETLVRDLRLLKDFQNRTDALFYCLPAEPVVLNVWFVALGAACVLYVQYKVTVTSCF